MNDAFICDPIRTAIGRYGGSLSSVRTDDLGAIPIKALMQRNPNVDWEQLDDVILGNANQAGECNRDIAPTKACPSQVWQTIPHAVQVTHRAHLKVPQLDHLATL